MSNLYTWCARNVFVFPFEDKSKRKNQGENRREENKIKRALPYEPPGFGANQNHTNEDDVSMSLERQRRFSPISLREKRGALSGPVSPQSARFFTKFLVLENQPDTNEDDAPTSLELHFSPILLRDKRGALSGPIPPQSAQ